MDETSQSIAVEAEKLDIRFIVTGVCFVLFGIALGYLSHSLITTNQPLKQISETKEDAQIETENSILEDEENAVTEALTELVVYIAPSTTPDGEKFIAGLNMTNVTMDYPATVRIYKVGSPDPYTINYGQKNFDYTQDFYYKVEFITTNGELTARLRVDELDAFYGFEGDHFVYEPYGDKFYSVTGSDRDTPVSPHSVGFTKSGQNIYQFLNIYGIVSDYKYVVIKRDLIFGSVSVELEHSFSALGTDGDKEIYGKEEEIFISVLEKILKSIKMEKIEESIG